MTAPGPRISIVTPSLNRARYIGDNIRSVLAQDDAQWEHIIVDGGSTDGTIDVLQRHPHLRWVSEPDRGLAHALNKGFAMARGQIIGWLNAEDTYVPGALATVSREIDRARDRRIIVGRCELVDDATPTGLYHPREYRDRQRLIEIWKGYAIPQPAVFFHTDVLARCGGANEQLDLGVDYDLFLRFSLHYWFHEVDAVLATYRLHGASMKLAVGDEDQMRRLIAISRRHWGRRSSAAYWYYLCSSRATLSPLGLRANKMWNQSVQARGRRRYATAAGWFALAIALFPPLLWRRGRYALFHAATRAVGLVRAWRVARFRARIPVVEGTIFDDGWVSEYAVVRCECSGPAADVVVEGKAHLQHLSKQSFAIRVSVNGYDLGQHIVRRSGVFRARFVLPPELRAVGRFDVSIAPDAVFVPRDIGLSDDARQLSFILSHVYARAE